MRRVKVLIEDGRFHFDDVDEELHNFLLDQGVSFDEESTGYSFEFINLRQRQRAPSGWMPVLDNAIRRVKEEYRVCRICHMQCGIDRFSGTGPCGATRHGEYFDLFVHPGMENGLERVLHVMMTGCSLDCFFCHKDQERNRRTEAPGMDRVSREEVLETLRRGEFNAVAFSGGNPDENLLAILELLREVDPFPWPILWETHGCIHPEILRITEDIVDLFILTIKFGNDDCALRLGGVSNYMQWICPTLEFLSRREKKSLVRLSKLAGHDACCYARMQKIISKYRIEKTSKVTIRPGFNYAGSVLTESCNE